MEQPRLVPIKLDNYKPLRELVFDSLRKAIIIGKLKPGERLMEIQLAEEMGVSRTPVREAIRKLELEGFVVMVPRKGAYVAGVSVKDIADVFEVRSALEGLAASLASERITEEEMEDLEKVFHLITGEEDLLTVVKKDNEFHELIYKASRNQRLT
ncbi:MAG: GntR family transcriptional regulator, partial [Desulfotomaculaceae bacterium]|nr:GntR family transcriptional regulator [Desulfotomaculaceae bacterium]